MKPAEYQKIIPKTLISLVFTKMMAKSEKQKIRKDFFWIPAKKTAGMT
jgi:hypothetical protein